MTASSIWQGLVRNLRWFGAGAIALTLAVLSILLVRRNSSIKKLQADLEFYKAQLELEKLASDNKITMGELQRLQLLDIDLEKQIAVITAKVQNEVKDALTAEEIAERFKTMGVLPKG
jgi:hypothetical protein